jgi:type I restriction enzyme M protein
LNEKFYFYCQKTAGGGAQGNISPNEILKFQIPIPPIPIQHEISEEIESYQKIIDGARQVVENYKPCIDIDPAWEMVELEKLAKINDTSKNPSSLYDEWFTYIDISSVENGSGLIDFSNKILIKDAPSRARRVVHENDILLSTVRPNLKAFAFLDKLPERPIVSTGFAVLTAKKICNPRFLYFSLFNDYVMDQMISKMGRGSYPSINQQDVSTLLIPLPNISEQDKIVESLLILENAIIANKQVIAIYQKKIKDRIAKVWGE